VGLTTPWFVKLSFIPENEFPIGEEGEENLNEKGTYHWNHRAGWFLFG
jgi:hypothetical protein